MLPSRLTDGRRIRRERPRRARKRAQRGLSRVRRVRFRVMSDPVGLRRRRRWPDIEPIWADDGRGLDLRVNIGDLIEAGPALCDQLASSLVSGRQEPKFLAPVNAWLNGVNSTVITERVSGTAWKLTPKTTSKAHFGSQ